MTVIYRNPETKIIKHLTFTDKGAMEQFVAGCKAEGYKVIVK